MMIANEFDTLIATLEFLKQKPHTMVNNADEAKSFLTGFSIAAETCLGLDSTLEIRKTVVTSRGWIWSSSSVVTELRRAQFDDVRIVDEIIGIEIDVWKRIRDSLAKKKENSSNSDGRDYESE